MIKIKPIKSSSMGNMFIIESNGHSPLILDAGLTEKEFMSVLKTDIKHIGGAVITHKHQDHAKGVKSIATNYNIDTYMPQEVADIERLNYNRHSFIIKDRKEFKLCGFTILPVEVGHINQDGSECETYNFLIKNLADETLAYITDCGKAVKNMPNAKAYIIECNYDEVTMKHAIDNGLVNEVYMNRTMGDGGHISMQECAEYLNENIGENTEIVMLMHISVNGDHQKHLDYIKHKTGFKNVVVVPPNTYIKDEYKVGYEPTKILF